MELINIVFFRQKPADGKVKAKCPGCHKTVTAPLKSSFIGMKTFECPGCQLNVFLRLSKNIIIAYVVIFIYIIYDLATIYNSVSERIWVTMDIIILGILAFSFLKHFTGLDEENYQRIGIEDETEEEE